MIHFTCDCCKRIIDAEVDMRYVVRMEVYAAMESVDAGDDDDRDHLSEIQDILERMEDAESDRIGDEVYQQLRFDLCTDCRKRFLNNPIVREPAKQLNFSEN